MGIPQAFLQERSVQPVPTLPTALAAPVEDGMMLPLTERPPLQSFLEGPSTVFCVAVAACTVVIRPSLMPQFSLMICRVGWGAVRYCQGQGWGVEVKSRGRCCKVASDAVSQGAELGARARRVLQCRKAAGAEPW